MAPGKILGGKMNLFLPNLIDMQKYSFKIPLGKNCQNEIVKLNDTGKIPILNSGNVVCKTNKKAKEIVVNIKAK
jgi:hypothetical protein